MFLILQISDLLMSTTTSLNSTVVQKLHNKHKKAKCNKYDHRLCRRRLWNMTVAVGSAGSSL